MWTCAVCTFANEQDEYLTCEVCQQRRDFSVASEREVPYANKRRPNLTSKQSSLSLPSAPVPANSEAKTKINPFFTKVIDHRNGKHKAANTCNVKLNQIKNDDNSQSELPPPTKAKLQNGPNALAKLMQTNRKRKVEDSETFTDKTEKQQRLYHITCSPTLSGQYLIEDFISEEEERLLLTFLDRDPCEGSNGWKLSSFNGPHLGKSWGVKTDLATGIFTQRPERPIPKEFHFLINRIRKLKLPVPKSKSLRRGRPSANIQLWRPNEANAIAYHRNRGHVLGPHCDNRKFSGAILATLSLDGDALMTYSGATRKNNEERHRVFLPRRSIQIQTGIVRYEYMHGIQNIDLPESGRRVSITFRQNSSGFGFYDEAARKILK